MPDYYEILGVDRSADAKTIRKAYLKLSLQYHPDKNPDNVAAAQAQFVQIGQAYQVLSDPVQRRKYDANDAFQESNPQSYASYREAFDATMAGMSDDELRQVLGVASLVGSVVGSILGSRLAKENAILRGVGSVVGSMLVSEAATSMVQNVHHQSRERAALDQERRERVARGETVPPREAFNPQQAWKDLVKNTTDTMKDKAAAAMFKNLGKR